MKHLFRLLILLLICPILIFAQGELDSTFGGSGAFRISSPSGSIADSAVQADGKIVSVGSCITINARYPVCLVRLNDNGSADQTFGDGIQSPSGQVQTTIAGYNPNISTSIAGTPSVVIQNDGKIVVAAYATISGFGLKSVLIRYNTNGSLDTTFGDQGFKTLDFFTGIPVGEMVLQPDGKMVVIGQNFVARYLPDGNVDTSFGENGRFTILAGLGDSIELRIDGKFIISGSMGSVGLIGRINANGTLDTSFGDGGYKTVNGLTQIQSISVSADNKIAILSTDNTVYRLNSNGSLDTTFDFDGSRPVFGSTTVYGAYDLVASPSGKITVVGNRLPVNSGVSIDYMVARFALNGSPDTTFSGDGLFEFNIFSVDCPRSIVFDRSGKAIIAGFSAQGTVQNPYETPYFSIARLSAPPAQNVRVSGRLFHSSGKQGFNAHLVLRKGSVIVAQARSNQFGYFNFSNVPAPDTYTISVVGKRFNFTERDILVDAAISNMEIVSQ